jgi:hypothetical protein
MRAIAAASTLAAAVTIAGPGLAQEGFMYPSCISSTLAASTARLIPSEAKGPSVRQLRGVVIRALTWRPGHTVKVCFRSGTRGAQERVARVAQEWSQYANVTFDFTEGGAPRKCRGDGSEDIKIDFVDGRGWWSYYGSASRVRDPSMNLQFFGVDTPLFSNGQPAPEAEIRRIILHEFGHALGMLHEHQSPAANCDAEIDWNVAYKLGESMGWNREQVNQNFRQLLFTDELNMSEVDRKSIMHYSLPAEIFKQGKRSPCWIPGNMDLSVQDRRFIAGVYPRSTAPVVSSATKKGPDSAASPDLHTSSTRGAKPPTAVTKDDVEGTIKRYVDLLQKSGVAKDKISSLAAEFRKTLTGK